MYDIDFLAVENENQESNKSGDAIILSIDDANSGGRRLIVIDAGFTSTGDRVVENIKLWYGTHRVDLVISTHPDSDHLNGLQTVIESLDVDELMLHLPWNHHPRATELGNYENVRKLYDAAVRRGTSVTEPFTGEQRFNGSLRLFGPSKSYYEEQIQLAVDEALTGAAATRLSATRNKFLRAGKKLVERALSVFPIETLSDADETGPRNQTSVITFVSADNNRMLFTGDAGIKALEQASNEYESIFGSFKANPLSFLQAPHHGSQRNLGPEILDRVLGKPGIPHGETTSFISSAKSSDKHPSPKVTNALGRRGAKVMATEGSNIHNGTSSRPGYTNLPPLPPLEEDND